MKPIIISNKKTRLTTALAAHYTTEAISAKTGGFADGERFVNLDNPPSLADKTILLVAQFVFSSKSPSINDQLLDHLFLAHHIKSLRVKKIIMLMPYLPYGRQVKGVDNKAVGPLNLVGQFCKAAGIDEIISCQLHEEQCKKSFPIPLHEIRLDDLWHTTMTNNFSPDELQETCFVSPDKGGIERVQRLAKRFDAPSAHVEKKRVDLDVSVAQKLVGDVSCKNVIIIDDIIDTGRTSVEAANMVLTSGAERVCACFCHGVFSDGGERIAASKIEKIWISDTVIHEEQSVAEVVESTDLILKNLDTLLQ